MINSLFGIKTESTRKYDQEGTQIPVTEIWVGPMMVTQIKNREKDGYSALQLGISRRNFSRLKKPQQEYFKGAGIDKAPLYLREVKIEDNSSSSYKVGDEISPADVLKAGDLVNVAGVSKGKGFTGVVKRWHFAGGPKTHGQSDRQRAPGSIGQTTTPGRVYKGKKMAGRSGGKRVTIKNLVVMKVDQENNTLLIKGLVPGARKGLLEIRRVGQAKRFISLLEKGQGIFFDERKEKAGKKETGKKESEEKNN